MLYDQIGNNIKKLRQRKGMTQDQLSDILCVSRQMISKYESGATAPDIATLVRLCGVFGVTLDVICGLDEDSRDALIRRLTEKYSPVSALSPEDARERYRAFLEESGMVSGDDRVMALELRLLGSLKDISSGAEREDVGEKIFERASAVLDVSKDDELRSFANYLLALYYWEKPADSPDYEKNLALSREYASKILLVTYFPDYKLLIGNDTRSEKLIADLQSQNVNFFAKMLFDTLNELLKHGINPVMSENYHGVDSILGLQTRPDKRVGKTEIKETEKMTKPEPLTMPDENYDWTKTLKPEQPYIHDYSKTLTYKLFLASPNETWSASNVRLTFEQALNVMKRIDALTPGVPKIVYLVGWQYFGHDSKYPAWDEVNEALKRPGESALDSLKWLMSEGYKYNTTVSLHINIKDAYDDSPLWDAYIKNDLISKWENGDLRKGGIWNGKQCYLVSYCREWETGYLRARIDRLCEMLPIAKAGTIHIDAMQADSDPGHGYSLEDVQKVRNQIMRYFRKLGIDVTTEFIYYETPDWREKKEQLIGLCPLVYHLSQNLDEYMKRPASLITGVNCSRRFKEGNSDMMYKLFGRSIGIEGLILHETDETKRYEKLLEGICLDFDKLMWLNSLERVKAVVTADNTTAYFSDGVETDLNGETRKNGVILGHGGRLLCPVSAMGENTFVLYDSDGGETDIDMSTAFGYDREQSFALYPFTIDGVGKLSESRALEGGHLRLTTTAGQAYIIKAN